MILIPKYRDSLQLEGTVGLVLVDAQGNVKDERYFSNLVVDSGKAWIAKRFALATPSVTPMTHMGLGTGSTGPSDTTRTTLLTEIGTRKTVTTDDTTTAQVKYSATFNAGEATGALTEAGIFTALTTGTMLCRTVFSTVNKAAADVLTINWTITIS